MKKVLFLMLVSIFIITGCGCDKKKQEEIPEEKPKINEEILKEQEVENLKIHDVDVRLEEGNTVFTIHIKNTSEEDIYIKEFLMNFKDENGNAMLPEPVLNPFYDTIEAGEIQALSVLIRQDITNAASVVYEIVN